VTPAENNSMKMDERGKGANKKSSTGVKMLIDENNVD